jgi:hypothetical protein
VHSAGPEIVGFSSLSGSDRPMPHKHNADRRHHIPEMSFKVRNWPAGRRVLARYTSPAEHLLRTNLPAPGSLGHTGSWNEALLDDPCLLLRRPTAPTARPYQHLNPTVFTLRVIINVKHNDSSMPSASGNSTTVRPAIE